MAEKRCRVIPEKRSRGELPQSYSEAVALLTSIDREVGLKNVARRLQLKRGRGYQGIDLLMPLVGMFTAGGRGGLKGWLADAAPHNGQLAAVMGRRSLPTQSALSRTLAAIETDHAAEFGAWLLAKVSDWPAMLANPASQHRDTRGEHWHLFDFDPTVMAMRERALPEGEDLPPAVRLARGLASPGYTGRKRGQLAVSYGLLQHSGTSLWAGSWLWSGGSAPRAVRLAAVRRVAEIAKAGGVDPSRCVMRCDGGIFGVPLIDACQRQGIGLITRLHNYKVLKLEPVSELLAHGQWHEVADSGSGPRRQALELGTVSLTASPTTRREDGSHYGTVQVRTVVSRYRLNGRANGAGKCIDGWCYELFAALVPAAGWPAAEVVTSYYGRCGQESRFAQLGQTIDVMRVFSYQQAGQSVAVQVGLMVHNLRVQLGARLLGDNLGQAPPHSPRQARLVADPQPMPTPNSLDSPMNSDNRCQCDATDLTTEVDANLTSRTIENGNETESTHRHGISYPKITKEHRQALLTRIDLGRHLARLGSGWRAGADGHSLICPANHRLHAKAIQPYRDGGLALRLRPLPGLCGPCPLRGQCSSSDHPRFRKEVWALIPVSEVAAVIPDQLRLGPPPRRRKLTDVRSSKGAASADEPVWLPPIAVHSGPWQAEAAALIPTELSHRWRRLHRAARVSVTLTPAKRDQPARQPWLAHRALGGRQRRRKTWTERQRAFALPATARVQLTFHAPPALAPLLAAKQQGTP